MPHPAIEIDGGITAVISLKAVSRSLSLKIESLIRLQLHRKVASARSPTRIDGHSSRLRMIAIYRSIAIEVPPATYLGPIP
jgi:hypothetical protein